MTSTNPTAEPARSQAERQRLQAERTAAEQAGDTARVQEIDRQLTDLDNR